MSKPKKPESFREFLRRNRLAAAVASIQRARLAERLEHSAQGGVGRLRTIKHSALQNARRLFDAMRADWIAAAPTRVDHVSRKSASRLDQARMRVRGECGRSSVTAAISMPEPVLVWDQELGRFRPVHPGDSGDRLSAAARLLCRMERIRGREVDLSHLNRGARNAAQR